MAGYNRIILIGNLVDDPKLRYTPSTSPVANFRLAVNTRFRSANAEGPQDETLFIDIVVFGKQAETCTQYLTKGRQVLVEGRLRIRSWEGKDNQRHTRTEVLAERVQFLGAKPTTPPQKPEKTEGESEESQGESSGEGDLPGDDEPPF